jgi:long-chain acyl-CoA synthetase
VEAEVARGVAAANAKLARVEQIKRWHVVDGDWLPGGDELTPTMKLKRRPIREKYAAELEGLYV